MEENRRATNAYVSSICGIGSRRAVDAIGIAALDADIWRRSRDQFRTSAASCILAGAGVVISFQEMCDINVEPVEDVTEPRRVGSVTTSVAGPAFGVALLRNLRKTECGAGQFLDRFGGARRTLCASCRSRFGFSYFPTCLPFLCHATGSGDCMNYKKLFLTAIVLALTLPRFAGAQGTLIDYQRAAGLRA